MFKLFFDVNNLGMFIVFIRVLIIYLTVLVFMRIMGKRQIGQMQPYEVVITLIIADLATLPMSDNNIPLLNGILPLAVLVIIHFIITFITRKSVGVRNFLSGKPVVIISPQGIEYEALKNLNMNIDDILEAMRQNSYNSFDQVLFAIVETNGTISIIPTSQNAPATAQDVGANNPPTKLTHVIVSDGKIIKEEMQQIDLEMDGLNKILAHLKLKAKQLILLCMDRDGKIYYQQKGESYKIIENINKVVKL